MTRDKQSCKDFLKERLKYRSDEGRHGSVPDLNGVSGFKAKEVSYEIISLLFDEEYRPIVTKMSWLEELKSGEVSRILGARIDTPKIIAIRSLDIPKLLSLEDIQHDLDFPKIFEYIEKFMAARKDNGPPFYRVISGLSYRSDGEHHAFDIFPEERSDGRDFERKIFHFWEFGAMVQRSLDGTLSLEFQGNLEHNVSQDDQQLIAIWGGLTPADNLREMFSPYDKKFRRLIYARLAEKAAVSIYSSLLGKAVEDCSILQITGADDRWRDFDIWAERPIDVKNATIYRRNARQNFVPKFKKSEGHDVIISAFATTKSSFRGLTQTFLGEVSKYDLELTKSAVQQAFPEIEAIQVRFDDQYLPAWAFEYPFGQLNYEELLSAYELLAERPQSILAAALAAGRVQNIGAYDRLKPSQRRIVDSFSEVVRNSSYTKRTIVLFAISGFISQILSGESPLGFVGFFRKLFQMEALGGRDQDRVGAKKCPPFPNSETGGLADPLRSVSNMFTLLEQAAEEISVSGLEFSMFHAPHPHILLGRLKNGKKITIYAYCGGRSDEGIPCDTFPLVVGKNASCRKCGKLVCHECGFCSAGCQ